MSDIPLPGGGTLKLYDSIYTPQQIEASIGKGPIIKNGTWWLWDVTTMTYQDTGIALASGLGPGSVTTPMLADGSVTWPKLAAEARPNRAQLLDNAYFATPDAIVDQRGGLIVPQGVNYYTATDGVLAGITDKAYTATVYDTYWVTIVMGATTYYVSRPSAIRGYCADGYSIDRWCINSGMSLDIGADSITLHTGAISAYSNFFQKIEPYSLENGRVYTASILYKTDVSNLAFGLQYKPGYNLKFAYLPAASDWNLVSFSVPAANIESPVITLNGGGTKQDRSIQVKGMKLELGSNQTLAHQNADGNWVLNDPPPKYGEGLAECQRYNVRYSDIGGIAVGISNGAAIYMPVSLPVSLRARPTVIFDGCALWNGTSGVHDPVKSIAVANWSNDKVYLMITPSTISLFPSKTVCVLEVAPGHLEISADL